MAEKSSLDEKSDKIEKHDNAHVIEPIDALVNVKRDIDKRRDNKEALEKRNIEVTKELKQTARKMFWKELWRKILILLDTGTYVKLIQSFEDLLFVLFVDIIFLVILFSLVYILYIIVNIGNNTDYTNMILKISGATIACILGIVIQINLSIKNKKEG